MTTKTSGGKITGLLALTMEGQVALDVGDPVMVTGDYEVGLATGAKPTLGHVSVANVKRLGRDYPVPNVPGDVTVEARGFYVRTITVGAVAITAGASVGIGALSTLVASAGGVDTIGIALQGGAPGTDIDVLVR
jgi:hypothetical protein